MTDPGGTISERRHGDDATGVGAPWLSILVPVYDVEAYLPMCLDSILSQMPAEGVELILLDDASPDGSRALCDAAQRDHPSIVRVVAHGTNQGLSAARNTMLDAARGEYVWFVDSDDEVLPGSVASLRAIVEAHAPDLILCGYRKNGKDIASFAGADRTFSVDREALVYGIFASRRMHSWSKIARRSMWGHDLRFPVGRCFEDIATTPLLALRARSYFYAGESWIDYRVRAGSITGQMSRTRGSFDICKNDDLSDALGGFVDAAHRELPHMSAMTRYAIGQFWAKEFTKLCWRLLSRRGGRDRPAEITATLSRYRARMESRSLMPFATLNAEHRRRGKVGRWLVLGACLLLSGRRAQGGLT